MTDTHRTVFIASGISLLTVVIVPLLVCLAMMGGMAMSGTAMSNMMSSGGGGAAGGMGGMAWLSAGFVLLASPHRWHGAPETGPAEPLTDTSIALNHGELL
jgi:hypothetical protein